MNWMRALVILTVWHSPDRTMCVTANLEAFAGAYSGTVGRIIRGTNSYGEP